MKKYIIRTKGKQLLFIILVFLFNNINIQDVQSQVGAYCGTCISEFDALNKAKIDLFNAQVELSLADKALIKAQDDLSSALYYLTVAKEYANTCESLWDDAKEAVSKCQEAVEYAELTLKAANDALAIAMSTGVGIIAALKLVAAATKLVAIATAALTYAVVGVATALATYLAAKILIPPLEENYNAAEVSFDNALDVKMNALQKVFDATDIAIQKQDELNLCIASIKSPGACQLCQSDVIIADDTQDPGVCKKCQNGEAVNDDSEDAGVCKICQNGVAVNNDSEDPGNCQKCVSGNTENLCSEVEQCCDGVCTLITYQYEVTETTITCTGSTSIVYYTNGSCSGGSTGQLFYSFGVCVGGSIVTISCSGPLPVPCP